MPLSLHSKRLAGPVTVTNAAAQLIATVPAGKVWSIKCIMAVNLTGANASYVLGIGGVIADQAFQQTLVNANADVRIVDLTVVLVAGEQIFARALSANNIQVTVSGFEFDA